MESQWGSSQSNDQFGCFVRITPLSYPATLIGIRGYFRNADASSMIKWKVYGDPGGTAAGGVSVLYTSPAAMANPAAGGNANQDYTAYVDLTSNNIVINSGDVYIGAVQNIGFFGAGIDNAPNSTVAIDRQWQWMNVFNTNYWNTLASQASGGQFGFTAFFNAFTTGMQDTHTNGNAVFPNPVSEYITIPSHDQFNSLRLYDGLGNVVKLFEVTDHLFVGDIPKGFYILLMEKQSGEKSTQKIIVN